MQSSFRRVLREWVPGVIGGACMNCCRSGQAHMYFYLPEIRKSFHHCIFCSGCRVIFSALYICLRQGSDFRRLSCSILNHRRGATGRVQGLRSACAVAAMPEGQRVAGIICKEVVRAQIQMYRCTEMLPHPPGGLPAPPGSGILYVLPERLVANGPCNGISGSLQADCCCLFTVLCMIFRIFTKWSCSSSLRVL